MDNRRIPEKFFDGPEYHTPERGGGPCCRPVAAAYFYWLVMRLVYRNWRHAVRGEYDRVEWAAGSLWALRMIERAGGRVHILHADVLEALDGPVVFAANHMSTLETFCLPCMILPHTPLSYVVKQSLLKVPGFGPVLAATDPIVVTREDPRQDLKDVLEQGCKHIAAGTSVCIFPQTTRTPVFDAGQFNSLAEKLAARAGAPVAPVAIKTDFWGIGRLIKDFGPVHPERDVYFAFGPPVQPGRGAAGRKAHAAIVEFIRANLTAWGAQCIG